MNSYNSNFYRPKKPLTHRPVKSELPFPKPDFEEQEKYGEFLCQANDGTKYFLVPFGRMPHIRYVINRLTINKMIVIEEKVYNTREAAERHAAKSCESINKMMQAN